MSTMKPSFLKVLFGTVTKLTEILSQGGLIWQIHAVYRQRSMFLWCP